MNLQSFEDQVVGRLVKSARGITGQCVSVSALWAEENGWKAVFGPTAYSIWLNFRDPAYQVIANQAGPNGNHPNPGDIVFFDSRFGGGAGHTGVCKSADLNQVTLIEQNDPYGTGVHEKTYSYFALAGWFHPVALGAQPGGLTGSSRNVTVTANPLNVRTAPTTSAVLAVNSTIPTGQVAKGTVLSITGYEHAQSVGGNDVWLRTSHNNWIWSGGTNW
ncbi:CHAP domain-containing protein [Nakamurella sp. PAMC28650]|uniref:CHAP domain-containing protein n=1 Tax=Nakamurella sp. PAMC28650 TaxID=2762325 RepID=UPI00164D7892|nr:CHAP domain-containing protein [Nakamurella sp. PAMC28650]